MQSIPSELVKISARVPKSLIKRVSRLHPKESLSELLRTLMEGEVLRQKVLKAHLKLYGRFKPEHFDESLL